MGRFLTRSLWVLAVLVCVGAVTWHVLTPAPAPPAVPQPSALPSPAANPFVGLGDDAPLPDAKSLTSQIAKIVDAEHGTYHVAVEDVLSKQRLVDLGAAKAGTPASSLKLLTGAAALATFEHTRRFPTTATLDSSGRLRLVGGGDSLLGAGESKPDSIAGHGGIASLAADAVLALKESGDVQETYKVYVDGTLFKGAALNPDWAPDLVTTNNITDVQTPALNAGRAGSSHSNPVVRQPATEALAAFVNALNLQGKLQGLSVTFVASGEAGRDAQATELARVESATLLEQLSYMEEVSDNFMAETFGRLVAIERGATGSFQDATAQIRAAVKELGVDVTGLNMVDASGLAATNKVSPATLASLLALTATSERADLRELASLLPVSGSTGTLSGRLTSEQAKGLIRAKTGTLAAVVSLSGYATTADGRLLSFSVMASDVKGAIAEARLVSDRIAASLLR